MSFIRYCEDFVELSIPYADFIHQANYYINNQHAIINLMASVVDKLEGRDTLSTFNLVNYLLLGLIKPHQTFFTATSDLLFMEDQFTLTFSSLWFLQQNFPPNKYENWFKPKTEKWCDQVKKYLIKRKTIIEAIHEIEPEKPIVGVYFDRDCIVRIAKFSPPEVEN